MKQVVALTTSCLLIFLLMLPFNESSVLANGNEPELILLKNTKENKTFKLKDGETLEQINKNGESYFVANTGKDSFKIVNENGVVSVINLRNNKVVETYTAKVENEESRIIITDDSEMGTYAVIDPGAGSKYKYVSTQKLSIDIISTSASVVAGVIASLIGGPVTGVIVTVASAAVSLALPKLYWKKELFQYKENVFLYRMWTNHFYKYHDYTGYLGSETIFTKNRVM